VVCVLSGRMLYGALGLSGEPQRPIRACQKAFARGHERQRATLTPQEPNAEPLLQLFDECRYGALYTVQPQCRTNSASFTHDCTEALQRLRVDRSPIEIYLPQKFICMEDA